MQLCHSLCGLGEFQLALAFTHHAEMQMHWSAMNEEARDHALERLLKDNYCGSCFGNSIEYSCQGSSDGPAQGLSLIHI